MAASHAQGTYRQRVLVLPTVVRFILVRKHDSLGLTYEQKHVIRDIRETLWRDEEEIINSTRPTIAYFQLLVIGLFDHFFLL